MKGCVNKVSLFDKDMMFVVIFGLRGFKHDLESQVALKCAAECHQAISNLKEVKSASIGVTTGKYNSNNSKLVSFRAIQGQKVLTKPKNQVHDAEYPCL